MYTVEQQRQHRKKWIKALRSGDYNQCQGRLQEIHTITDPLQEKSYCCLGVACDLYPYGNFDQTGTYRIPQVDNSPTENYLELPEAVMDYYGLTTNIGNFDSRNYNEDFGEDADLTELNDNGASFHEIAKVIEDEPEGLVQTN